MRRLVTIWPPAPGLYEGQPLAEARAIMPALDTRSADPEAERNALADLAQAAMRFTPMAAADPPDGLWLDLTGCAALWPDEDAMLAAIATWLAIPSRLALAGTTGAAWALAHAPDGPERCICPPGGEARALARLSPALLRLSPRAVAGLRRVGLREVATLARIPRAALTARYGKDVVRRMGHALGWDEEAIAWPPPAPNWEERLDFIEPATTATAFERALEILAGPLCTRLAASNLGGLRFTANFQRTDGTTAVLDVGTARPMRDAARLVRLFAMQLDGLDPGLGIETIWLNVDTMETLTQHQALLGHETRGADLAALADSLAIRLGQGRLWRPAPRPSHVPERSLRQAPLTETPSWQAPATPRPLRLLARPQPVMVMAPVPDSPPLQFRWRDRLYLVRAASGPERIAAEWWRQSAERDRLRDYYHVETTSGIRCWLFRAGLHGADRPPRWFLHGFFA
ncbi:MAG: DNA polymerase Y family protein [Rhodospirillales bacterium]|nr:DNA polymerase Y family protein [Rhodospirillales bacterium]